MKIKLGYKSTGKTFTIKDLIDSEGPSEDDLDSFIKEFGGRYGYNEPITIDDDFIKYALNHDCFIDWLVGGGYINKSMVEFETGFYNVGDKTYLFAMEEDHGGDPYVDVIQVLPTLHFIATIDGDEFRDEEWFFDKLGFKAHEVKPVEAKVVVTSDKKKLPTVKTVGPLNREDVQPGVIVRYVGPNEGFRGEARIRKIPWVDGYSNMVTVRSLIDNMIFEVSYRSLQMVRKEN